MASELMTIWAPLSLSCETMTNWPGPNAASLVAFVVSTDFC